jgi:uncharacterized protein YydD (DUF2326 family)
MVKLTRLYFEPNEFCGVSIKPVVFEKGINIILGEQSSIPDNLEEKKKMNGVGKSMLVESINFCFLKDLKDSRLSKIPITTLNSDVYICLDFEIESDTKIQTVSIKRRADLLSKILIIVDGVEEQFDDISIAKKYLESLIFPKIIGSRPSLRSLISILIRDEQTSYKDVLEPYGNSGVHKYSDLLKPHLYFFGMDVSILDLIRNALVEIDLVKKGLTLLNTELKSTGIAVKDIRAYLNDLEDNVNKLNIAVDALQPQEGIGQIQDELTTLLSKLNTLNVERSGKIFSSKQIKQLPKPEKIPINEVKILYNQYKQGLGDLVEKSFEQVLKFKDQVENFQHDLMNQKLDQLAQEIKSLDTEIEKIDKQIGELYKFTDARKRISDLTETLKLQRGKNEEYEKLKNQYRLLEVRSQEKKRLIKEKNQKIEELQAEIFIISKTITSFENDLKDAHLFIAGNKNCQFEFKTDESKAHYLTFDYRIKLDGSSGINRIKTFIYDVLLMINHSTSKRHPCFLIHDNIFASTGKDDMMKALNFLDLQEKSGRDFQYILTINKDEFEGNINELTFDYKKKVRVTLTRELPFFKSVYLEN